MNFEIGKYYKHKYMTDVCFEVKDILGPTEIYVSWINKLYKTPMGYCEIIEIKPREIENYIELGVI